MPSVALQRIVAAVLLGDGIDDGFIVSIGLFRGPGLTELLATVDLHGGIADNSRFYVDLIPQVPAIYDTDIAESTLYVDHKNGTGSGNDNTTGAIFLECFGQGYPGNGSIWFRTNEMPFVIGNNHVNQDQQTTLQHPCDACPASLPLSGDWDFDFGLAQTSIRSIRSHPTT